MKKHFIDTPVSETRVTKINGEVTREHAFNWALGTTMIALCLLIGVWALIRSITPIPSKTLIYVIMFAIMAGIVNGALKLISFTEEHRDFLYRVEELAQVDLDNDGMIGEPKPEPPGAFLRGLDGRYKRIGVALSIEEIQRLKAHLLNTGMFTVRAVNVLLGDETRATALRMELYSLGILEKPRDRAATKLTSAGKTAVMRWH